jgi:hypothetical protein
MSHPLGGAAGTEPPQRPSSRVRPTSETARPAPPRRRRHTVDSGKGERIQEPHHGDDYGAEARDPFERHRCHDPSRRGSLCVLLSRHRRDDPRRLHPLKLKGTGACLLRPAHDDGKTPRFCRSPEIDRGSTFQATLGSVREMHPKGAGLTLLEEDSHGDLVNITPPPVLPWFERLDNRVPGGTKVPGRVAILRGVATTDVPTG